MVRQLAGIKLKSQWNTMRAQVAILVLAILGYIYGLGVTVALSVGIVAAMAMDVPLAATLAVGSGTLFTLGWVILPVVFASQEGTLDPAKLAPFMPPNPKLARGLVLVTGLGVAGVYLLIFVIAQVVGWTLRGGIAGALGIVVGAALGVYIGFLWSRVAVAAISLLQVGRKGREKAGLLAFFIIMAVFVPMGVWINVAVDNIGLQMVETVVNILAWTPFGAPWALPEALVLGQYSKAAVLLLIAGVTALLGWRAWRSILPAAMSGRRHHLSDTELAEIEAEGTLSQSANESSEPAADVPSPLLEGAKKWLRLGVSRPAAAVAERTRMYWLRDPRLSAQLIAAAALIFTSVAMGKLMFGGSDVPDAVTRYSGIGMLALSALIVGQIVGSLLQYDSTAFWVQVSAATRGRDDRLGRILGSLLIIGAFVGGGTLIFGLLMGLPASEIFLIFTLLALLTASGEAATSIIAAQWIYPVQPPGASPLSSKGTGQFWVTMIVSVAQLTFSGLLALIPAGFLAFGIFGGGSTWLLAAVISSWVWTLATLAVGVWISGKILDRSQVELLTKMAAWPGHRAPASG